MNLPEEPIQVLIVDDSALMRQLLKELLSSSTRIRVVGTARDGYEAIELARQLRPDVITLDVEMPRLSGLDTLPLLLDVYPVPVVMISSWTHEGATTTVEALERGAVDFLPKPTKNQLTELRSAHELIVNKIITAAQTQVKPPPSASKSMPPQGESRFCALELPTRVDCVVIGISIGGPQTLVKALRPVKPPLPPVLITQHMPDPFVNAFAARLDRGCSVPVAIAANGGRLEPNRILLAPGTQHLSIMGRRPTFRIKLDSRPPVSGHRPSIDVLFQSAALTLEGNAVGILMTGMGRDGVEGCRQIQESGGFTFGQDESSSIVYGMNKIAFEQGYIKHQLSSNELASLLMELGRRASG